jgi:acetyl esterase/lipase
MLVYRLEGRRFDAGIVTLETRSVRWLDLTPDIPIYGRAAQWANDRELVLLARADGDLPRHLHRGWEAAERLPQLWARTATGRSAARTMVGSGRFLADRPRARPGRLLRIDAGTGRATTLAQGEFVDLEVSRSGRFAAVVENGADVQAPADEPRFITTPTRRRSLMLVDLRAGRTLRPDLAGDVALGLLAWSPEIDALLALALPRPGSSGGGRLVRISPEGEARTVALPGLTLETVRNREGSAYVRADWMGREPLVFARDRSGRADWHRVSAKGPVRLTGALAAPGRRLLSLSPGALTLAQGREIWRVDRRGHAERRPGAPPADVEGRLAQGARLLQNPPLPTVPPLAPEPAAGARTGRVASTAEWGVDLTQDPNGVRRLSLVRPGAPPRPLLSINRRLADVSPAEIVAVRHAGPLGQPVTSWLYLPPERDRARPLPVVVIPYRGFDYATPPWRFDPGDVNVYMNAQVLVGAGYAVLAPSLPYDEAAGAPTRGVAQDIGLALDAAAARVPLDLDRVALYGQSFGATGAVAAASQSDRFKSVIAVSGLHDLAGMWGGFALHQWVVPEDGLSSPLTLGSIEGGQPHMGAPPWGAPGKYLAGSNLFAAGTIEAPVLLVHGEADEVRVSQSQAMFTALYRQGKDARFVTYWGEDHVLASPANIRDFFALVLEWLKLTLPPPAAEPPRPAG